TPAVGLVLEVAHKGHVLLGNAVSCSGTFPGEPQRGSVPDLFQIRSNKLIFSCNEQFARQNESLR
ncbi:hypothetical protein KI387_018019, partial [Taxus chinensis]